MTHVVSMGISYLFFLIGKVKRMYSLSKREGLSKLIGKVKNIYKMKSKIMVYYHIYKYHNVSQIYIIIL
jgi:hypothetical protein